MVIKRCKNRYYYCQLLNILEYSASCILRRSFRQANDINAKVVGLVPPAIQYSRYLGA